MWGRDLDGKGTVKAGAAHPGRHRPVSDSFSVPSGLAGVTDLKLRKGNLVSARHAMGVWCEQLRFATCPASCPRVGAQSVDRCRETLVPLATDGPEKVWCVR